MRVLQLTHTGVASGGEIALGRLANELRRRNIDTVVACGAEGTFAEGLRAGGVPVVVVRLPRHLVERRRAQLSNFAAFGVLPATLLYAARVAVTARRVRADVLHTNSMKAHVAGMLAGWFTRRPVIVHLHDDLAHVGTGRIVSAVFRWLLQRVPVAVVGCSGHVLRVADLPDVPTAILYSGVPSEMVNDVNRMVSDDVVVGMVARIAEWKGQHLFLDAAEIVTESEPAVRFRIVGAPMFGEDDYLERLRQRADHGPLEGRIELAGFRADTTAEYDQLAVAVACSVEPEPFGQVVVEAMARGCAVVAPSEGGPLEVITSEVDGLLVAPRDADALAEAILRLVRDGPWRSLLGHRATETVKSRFTVEVTAQSFVDLLTRIGST